MYHHVFLGHWICWFYGVKVDRLIEVSSKFSRYVDVFFFSEKPPKFRPKFEKIRLQVLPLLRNPRRVWPSGVNRAEICPNSKKAGP